MRGATIDTERVRKAMVRLRGDVTTGGKHIVRDLRSTRNAIRRDLRSLGRGLTPHRTNHTHS